MSIAFRAVRPCFRLLVDWDEIDRSPMDKMKAPVAPANPPAVLSDDDMGRLLATCKGADFISGRDAAMLSLLLDTGMRRGELGAMHSTRPEPPADGGLIDASTSKSRRGRAVTFGPSTANAITRYLRHPKAPHGH